MGPTWWLWYSSLEYTNVKRGKHYVLGEMENNSSFLLTAESRFLDTNEEIGPPHGMEYRLYTNVTLKRRRLTVT